jgi:branched-chain amino acid transport system ATP-binding protein
MTEPDTSPAPTPEPTPTASEAAASEPAASEPAASEAPLLEVRNLVTGYGDIRVVWDVSLSVQPGKITALLGRNGAGKTTTLRAIAGLNRIGGGSVLFKGDDISKLAAHKRVRRGIGFVQEGKRIFHRRTVYENLLLGGYSLGLRRSQLPVEVERIFELFPALKNRAKTPASSLSGGQQQMVAIGQALMAKPTLLMLDEPSGGLAPSVVAEVMNTVTGLTERGLGIVLVEQAVESAVAVADDIVVLDIGRVVLHRKAGEVNDLQLLREAYFGRAPEPPDRLTA